MEEQSAESNWSDSVKTKMRTNQQTQWSAQFFVAAELTRRGYLVTFTLGNAPGNDLIVKSPEGKPFLVEIKGLKAANAWFLRQIEINLNLFYFFVVIPPIVDLKKAESPRLFIMTSQEAMAEVENYKRKILKKGGKYHENMGGFNWSDVLVHEDKWEKIPE